MRRERDVVATEMAAEFKKEKPSTLSSSDKIAVLTTDAIEISKVSNVLNIAQAHPKANAIVNNPALSSSANHI